MTPIPPVSACAWAYVQSRLKAAAAAAEFFRSVLRDVFIAFLPRNTGKNNAYRLILRAVIGLSIWRTQCNVNAAIWPLIPAKGVERTAWHGTRKCRHALP